jgi:hypothetical protein
MANTRIGIEGHYFLPTSHPKPTRAARTQFFDNSHRADGQKGMECRFISVGSPVCGSAQGKIPTGCGGFAHYLGGIAREDVKLRRHKPGKGFLEGPEGSGEDQKAHDLWLTSSQPKPTETPNPQPSQGEVRTTRKNRRLQK